MRIYIPTRGRPDHQRTAEALVAAGIPVTLVLSEQDPDILGYTKWNNQENIKIVIIKGARDIGQKRQAIMGLGEPMLCMMDDDLRFRRRNKEGKFEPAEDKDLVFMVSMINEELESYAHVGLCDEFMSNTRPRGTVHAGRYNQVLAYNQNLFPDPKPRFRLGINEEHDMNLQLQAQGLAPSIICEFTKGQKFYAKGGLSHYRTAEVEKQQHEKFANYWPDLVTVKPCDKSLSKLRVQVKWAKALKV
jgi:hypothetical protein